MPDSSGAVHLGAPTEGIESLPEDVQRRLEELAEQTGTKPGDKKEPVEVITAFVIFQTLGGEWSVAGYDGEALAPQRGTTNDDLFAGSAVVQKDIAAYDTAQASLQMQMQQMAAMQEQIQRAQIQQRLQQEGGLR